MGTGTIYHFLPLVPQVLADIQGHQDLTPWDGTHPQTSLQAWADPEGLNFNMTTTMNPFLKNAEVAKSEKSRRLPP